MCESSTGLSEVTQRALVMLVNENAELRCEVERLREQLDVERWDSFNAVLSCGVDERDVDRTFEGLSEHGVRKPRVIQSGDPIPPDVKIVALPSSAQDPYAYRTTGNGWQYAESVKQARYEVGKQDLSDWGYFDVDEYPLTEVLPETDTTAKAS